MLKANSKKTLDIIAGQKKRDATAAYKATHPDVSNAVAAVQASKLLAKPEAQLYLNEHVNKAKATIVELMDSEKDDIRLRASTDVLDRTHGKAIQQIQQTTVGVTLNIDLTSALPDDAAEASVAQPITSNN